jgi:uncharacterized protein
MLKLSEHVRFYKINDDLYILWNRFFPGVIKLNERAFQLLFKMNGNKFEEKNKIKDDHYTTELLKYRLLYRGNVDPYPQEFKNQVEGQYRLALRKAEDFYTKEQEYAQLYLYNTSCNLKCSYCIRNYKRSRLSPYPIFKRGERKRILNIIADQYIERKAKSDVKMINISLNGGEIFLEWDLMRSLVERLQNQYSTIKFKYFVNTNMTLLTEKMAQFISKHDFEFNIGIDGYVEAHNTNRKYHNGKGSFGDVMRALEIYRGINSNCTIDSFQGTIDHPEAFQPEKVYNMNRFSFKSARLGANLLNVSDEKALNQAMIYKKFLELNHKYDFQVSDSVFENFGQLVNLKENFFYFPCNGLSTLPRMGIYIDISSMQASQICSYVPGAKISLKEINYNIYNPKLWELSKNFIRERIESLLKFCMECDLIGVCKGSCVMNGLDHENRKNSAACLFQNEMWKIYLCHLCLDDFYARKKIA